MKITVIIPTYNRPDLLPRALESVQKQSWPNLEVLVVDDASRTSAESIVNSFKQSLPNIRFIRHEKNKGVNAARNTGVAEAHGDIISFLDDDDEYLPDAFEKIHSAVEENPDAAIFYFNVEAQLKDRMEIRGYRFPEGVTHFRPTYDQLLLKTGRSGDAHVVIRHSVFEKTDVRFPEWINGFESFFYSQLAARGFTFLYCNGPVSRMHFEHDTHLGYDYAKYPRQYLYGLDMFLKEHDEFYKRYPQMRRELLFSLSKLALKTGKLFKAVCYFARAMFSSAT